MEEFKTVHQNSPDFDGFRLNELRKGKAIPVFFLYDNEGDLDSIGLAYMYRYPCFNTVYHGIPDSHFTKVRKDLTECIFGYTNKADSLRGRVIFSHAFLSNVLATENEKSLVLSTPHPSYYPLYLSEDQTWNSESLRIAGYKRYPVRNKIMESPQGTGDMTNTIIPLKQGSEFKGKIYFHNLKEIELGALLSALTFHGKSECYHSLGCAKPLGYGKSKLTITKLNCGIEQTVLLDIYQERMNTICNDWIHSQRLVELFAMAKGIPSGREFEFSYMRMSTSKDGNEFIKGKDNHVNNKDRLGSFSQILNGTVNIKKTTQQATKKNVNIRKAQEIFDDALFFYDKGEFDKTKEKLHACLSLVPSFADAKTYLKMIEQKEIENEFNLDFYEGEYRYKEKKYSEAIDCFIKCLGINPGHPETQSYLQIIFTELKEKAEMAQADGQLETSLETYNILQKTKIEDFSSVIEILRRKISNQGKTIKDSVKFGSLKAMTGNIQKWVRDHGTITDEETALLCESLKQAICVLKPKEQAKWKERGYWKQIEGEIDNALLNALFNSIQ